MKGKWNRNPLIFLYATVIMGIQIRKAPILIKGILLYIKPRRINMRPKDIHSLFHGLSADPEHGYRLIHPDSIYLIAAFQGFTLFDHILQFTVPFLFNYINNIIYAFSFRLAF